MQLVDSTNPKPRNSTHLDNFQDAVKVNFVVILGRTLLEVHLFDPALRMSKRNHVEPVRVKADGEPIQSRKAQSVEGASALKSFVLSGAAEQKNPMDEVGIVLAAIRRNACHDLIDLAGGVVPQHADGLVIPGLVDEGKIEQVTGLGLAVDQGLRVQSILQEDVAQNLGQCEGSLSRGHTPDTQG